MTNLDCLLVADDLTGACDAAVHFAVHGLRPARVLLADDGGAAGARVLGLTTLSRDLPAADMRAAMAAVAARLPVDSAGLIFKKIDSTLRGNAGMEIVAAMEYLGCHAAVVCPAFPQMGRIVEGGALTVTTAPDFDPIDVARLLQLQSGCACAHARPDGVAALLSAGSSMVSVDAASDRDLDRIASAILPMGRRILWAGSAGLASALARLLGQPSVTPPLPARRGTVLFCIGSDHPVTLAQQSSLLAGRSAVLAATRESIGHSLGRGKHVVLRIPRGMLDAEQVRALLTGMPAAALVLSGGDTASLVCRAAGVRQIELCAEIVPGIPRGILRGGEFDGFSVATKSGGFGRGDALIRIADFFSHA